jgi:hypothetical protein
MFWKWFGSDRKVMEALEQSTGYDLSPTIIQAPANTDEAPQLDENGKPKLELWTDYTFSQDDADIKIAEFWDNVAKNGGK